MIVVECGMWNVVNYDNDNDDGCGMWIVDNGCGMLLILMTIMMVVECGIWTSAVRSNGDMAPPEASSFNVEFYLKSCSLESFNTGKF